MNCGWSAPPCECEASCNDDTSLNYPDYLKCVAQCSNIQTGEDACYDTAIAAEDVCIDARRDSKQSAQTAHLSCLSGCTTDACKTACGVTYGAALSAASAAYNSCVSRWYSPLLPCRSAAITSVSDHCYDTINRPGYENDPYTDCLDACDIGDVACRYDCETEKETLYAQISSDNSDCRAAATDGRNGPALTAQGVLTMAQNACSVTDRNARSAAMSEYASARSSCDSTAQDAAASVGETYSNALDACSQTETAAKAEADSIFNEAYDILLAAEDAAMAALSACEGGCYYDQACLDACASAYAATMDPASAAFEKADNTHRAAIAAAGEALQACTEAALSARNSGNAEVDSNKDECYALACEALASAGDSLVGIMNHCQRTAQANYDETTANLCSTDSDRIERNADYKSAYLAVSDCLKDYDICMNEAFLASSEGLSCYNNAPSYSSGGSGDAYISACNTCRENYFSCSRASVLSIQLAGFTLISIQMKGTGKYSGLYVDCLSECASTFFTAIASAEEEILSSPNQNTEIVGTRLARSCPIEMSDTDKITAYMSAIASARATFAACSADCCNSHYGEDSITSTLSDAVTDLIACENRNVDAGMIPPTWENQCYDMGEGYGEYCIEVPVFPPLEDCVSPWNTAVEEVDPDNPDDFCSPCIKVLYNIAATDGASYDSSNSSGQLALGQIPIAWIVGQNATFCGVQHPFDQNLTSHG